LGPFPQYAKRISGTGGEVTNPEQLFAAGYSGYVSLARLKI